MLLDEGQGGLIVNVLAVSTHPDDETLGCGGTLLRHTAEGDDIHWLIGTETHVPEWPADLVERKAQEVHRVADAYSMTSVHKLGHPTTELDTVPQGHLIDDLQDVLEEVQPDVVYSMWGGDVHGDHGALYDALASVLKSFYMQKYGVSKVLCYETLSSTDAGDPTRASRFIPQIYSDITGHLDEKIDIMQMFETEIQKDPLPRGPSAIEALARRRGATVGVEHAEAFMLVREVR